MRVCIVSLEGGGRGLIFSQSEGGEGKEIRAVRAPGLSESQAPPEDGQSAPPLRASRELQGLLGAVLGFAGCEVPEADLGPGHGSAGSSSCPPHQPCIQLFLFGAQFPHL